MYLKFYDLRQIDDLLSVIGDLDLSPNEYIALVLHLEKKKLPDTINEDLTFKHLRFKGYLDGDLKPTDKSSGMLSLIGDTFSVNVQRYRNLWPPLLLPSGKYAKATTKEIEQRFKWFFNNFNYSWEEIMQATEDYIIHFSKTNYVYMKTSSYFIYKHGIDKIKSSTLAEWCDKLKSEGNQVKDYEVDL